MINYLPNDPGVTEALPVREITPARDRPQTVARYQYDAGPAEATYPIDSGFFVFWQSREAALRAIAAWEAVDQPLVRWRPGTTLPLHHDLGADLNAYYTRVAIEFYHHDLAAGRVHTGASTDVVAHEVGHAILDAIRPDLWDSNLFEVVSFHEAFGDCLALLTALADPDLRTAVADLIGGPHSAEATAEALAAAIGVVSPGHNASAPRRARNSFSWDLPANLPSSGGPGALIAQWHSFGQIFSGCFYDLIALLYEAGAPGPDALATAARTAGRLLARGVRTAQRSEHFFRSVGRAMMLLPEAEPLRAQIRAAFERHGLALGSSIAFAPIAALPFATPPFAASWADDGAAMTLSPALRGELSARIGGGDPAAWVAGPVRVGGVPLVQATMEHKVPLDHVHPALVGVVALADESVLLDTTSFVTKIVGVLPNRATTHGEVTFQVQSLVADRRIAFPDPADGAWPPGTTHTIAMVNDQPTLVRMRFACGHTHRAIEVSP